MQLGAPIIRLYLQSAAMGALPLVRAAVDPTARGGECYGPGGWFEQRGWPVRVTTRPASYDNEVAGRLWSVSEELTGVGYSALGSAA
jgi:hypothetical protein